MKYLICLLVVILGSHMTLVQSQSAASIRIETAINKTITDFNTAMDRQNTEILRGLNAEFVLFEKDAKTAIIYIAWTSYFVAFYGLHPIASLYYSAAGSVASSINQLLIDYKEKKVLENIATEVKVIIDDYKSKVDTPVSELREKIKSELESNPNSQACYEKLIKDINTMTTSANKNITDSFTFASKDFKGKAKVAHANINTNVTVVLKKAYACIALRRADFVFLCIEKFLSKWQDSFEFASERDNEVKKILEENIGNLLVQADKIETNLTDQKDAIMNKIEKCGPAIPDFPGNIKTDPEIKAEVNEKPSGTNL